MQMDVSYFLVTKNGVIWSFVNLYKWIHLYDAFIVNSVSTSSTFTYILEHFQ